MYILMQIAFFFLDIIYLVIKLFNPVRHKVVFISRQSNQPSTDFQLVADRLVKDDPTIKTVMLCKMIDGGLVNKIKYGFHMFRQMAEIASSEAVVLDTYCIVASCLHHRKGLKIVQMWHGLGCGKKFGYSILGEQEGSSEKVAKAMHMHQQYDYVLVSSDACKKAFGEAFNVEQDKLVAAPLPKVDLLRNKESQAEISEKIKKAHPELAGKLTVLYAPTFRKDEDGQKAKIVEMIDGFDFEHFNLVLSLHPISKIEIEDSRVIIDHNFSSFQWGIAADKIVTDYSAAVYEFSLLTKEIYYFVYDLATYQDIRGMYTSIDEFPGPKCADVEQLLAAMQTADYDLKAVEDFANTYIDPAITDCTGHISDIIRNYPLNH